MKEMRILILAILMFILFSCTSTKYVEIPIETIKTEYVSKYNKDSVFVHDSIDRYINSDTVFQTIYKYKYLWVSKRDTVVKTDTIPKIVTVEKVEVKEINKIKWWLNLLIYFGIAALTILITSVYKRIKSIVR